MSREKPEPIDAAAWARDWVTIVQSELAALAIDPEGAEGVAAIARLWAEWQASQAKPAPETTATDREDHDAAFHSPGAGTTTRTTPAAAAPGAGDNAGASREAELEARVAELERRLAAASRKRPQRGSREHD